MAARDPYDPDVQLENAALLFLHHEAFVPAVALFAYLGDRSPTQSPLWYGLGNALARLAHERRSRSLLTLAIALLQRSLREDPSNPLAIELLGFLRDRSGIPAAVYEAIAPFEGNPLQLLSSVHYSADALVSATLALPRWQDRMGVVMYLRGQGIEDVVPTLIAAIERDPHPHVRMAALKGVGQWANRPDIRRCLEQLVSGGEWRQLQPYVGMALRSIDHGWAQRLASEIAE